MGELKQGREYRSREVFLAADLFEADFATAAAVFLHEHTHIFGCDGSRGFTDALNCWKQGFGTATVSMTWKPNGNGCAKGFGRKGPDRAGSTSASEWLETSDAAQLRKLLRALPGMELEAVLRRLQLNERN